MKIRITEIHPKDAHYNQDKIIPDYPVKVGVIVDILSIEESPLDTDYSSIHFKLYHHGHLHTHFLVASKYERVPE